MLYNFIPFLVEMINQFDLECVRIKPELVLFLIIKTRYVMQEGQFNKSEPFSSSALLYQRRDRDRAPRYKLADIYLVRIDVEMKFYIAIKPGNKVRGVVLGAGMLSFTWNCAKSFLQAQNFRVIVLTKNKTIL